MFEIVLDTHMRIEGLTSGWKVGLAELCSVTNEQKAIAIKEKIWGAKNLDDSFTLADVQDDTLVLPRGFKFELQELLGVASFEYRFKDRTSYAAEIGDTKKHEEWPILKPDQRKAINACKINTQGRLILPPGKGKTVIGLWLALERQQPTIILTDKKHIAKQWQERAEFHFGRSIGFIGDNQWDERYVTVALIQTLRSRKDELDEQQWWDKWGMLILDEQHHIPAETYQDIVQKFPAKFRYGVSATIGKSETKKRISELIFGDILFETYEQEAPVDIEVVKTDFDFDYIPTQYIKLKSGKKKLIRNNYQKMISELVNNKERNELIIETLLENKDNCNLIISNRLAHLKALQGLAYNSGFINTFFLRGQESLDERMEIYRLADNANCAIFATQSIAGEGLDIPRIDRVYLSFPVKNEETVWQIIGRGARQHEDKSDTIVYDFVDKPYPLENQFKHRLRELYQKKELKVSLP